MSVGASRVAAAARRGPLDALESVRAALGFLTRFPAGSRHGTVATSATGAAAFGFVGALVGAAGAVPMLLVGGLEPTVGAILAVMAVAVASGALHLDGLADTADALLVPDPARAEAARTDPATGPGGVVAVVLVLGLDVAALSALAAAAGPGIAALACIAAGSASRAVAVVASLAMRPSAAGRLGRWFAERLGTADAVIAVASTVAIVGIVGAGLRPRRRGRGPGASARPSARRSASRRRGSSWPDAASWTATGSGHPSRSGSRRSSSGRRWPRTSCGPPAWRPEWRPP